MKYVIAVFIFLFCGEAYAQSPSLMIPNSVPGCSVFNGCTFVSPVLFPAGSATAPGVGVGIAGTGLYSVSTTGLGFTINGVNKGDWGITTGGQWNFNTSVGVSGNVIATSMIAAGFNSLIEWTGREILTSPAAGYLQQGNVDAASPVAQSLTMQSVAAGTSNTAGVNWTVRGSLSTGSGTSGDIIFQTGGTGAAATTQNTAVTALTIKGATQHFSYGGSAPVVSACGGTVAGDANATDSSGTVSPGTAASCTITFGKAYTTFNHCRVTSQTTLAAFAYSYTLSAITVTATALAGGKLDYNCDGV